MSRPTRTNDKYIGQGLRRHYIRELKGFYIDTIAKLEFRLKENYLLTIYSHGLGWRAAIGPFSSNPNAEQASFITRTRSAIVDSAPKNVQLSS
jgi:hypothetical protein